MKDLIIQPDSTIRQAMKKLTQTGEKCLVIVDAKNILLGTLTDGDLRKAILRGVDISVSIEKIYQSDSTILVKNKFNSVEAKKLFTKNKFDLIPIVDDEGKLVDVIFWEDIFNNKQKNKYDNLDVPVVIMAGGRGTRLEPFTKVLPKPLVPVHEKPIIEHIIERFIDVGCSEFHLTVNYKSRILKAYFEELNPDYKIYFVEEKDPLGTAGSLRYLDGQFGKSFFVTNCDIIIKADYANLYEFHQKGGYDITLVASAKEYIVPYGTCELNDEGLLSRINEKPHYDFLINTGLYVLNPDVLKLIPENKFYHVTHLIEKVKNNGKKIGVYPIDDDAWLDVGEWAEYQKTVKQL
jgi:dTDP-glucose pyrophosphorylase